jgi:sulfatase modifying factor 1
LTKRYDIALSFAGEDREYAKQLADILLAGGIRVFFDEYEEDRSWGEDLNTYLTDIYKNGAQYVVMFISQFYPKKFWTDIELKAAQSAASQRETPYILPVRLDDTAAAGILSTVGYMDWCEKGAHRIANIILKKLGRMINEKDNAELILIPQAEFTMGSTKGPKARMPEHKVWLDSFYIYKNPVTYGQYFKFCEETRLHQPAKWVMEDLRPEADHPIVGVTWDEALDYCKWACVSLPSEAQWEKAARGTDGRRFPWGNAWEEGRCEYRRKQWGYAGIAIRINNFPRGSSPYGVQDMCGNIWEWCADWYDAAYYRESPSRNPKGPEGGREKVQRGCGWEDDIQFPVNFECSCRDSKEPGFRYRLNGFRCVLNSSADES